MELLLRQGQLSWQSREQSVISVFTVWLCGVVQGGWKLLISIWIENSICTPQKKKGFRTASKVALKKKGALFGHSSGVHDLASRLPAYPGAFGARGKKRWAARGTSQARAGRGWCPRGGVRILPDQGPHPCQSMKNILSQLHKKIPSEMSSNKSDPIQSLIHWPTSYCDLNNFWQSSNLTVWQFGAPAIILCGRAFGGSRVQFLEFLQHSVCV